MFNRIWIVRSPDGGVADPPSPTPTGGGDEKKFTQADLDRIAGETRAKGREAGVSELLKELGFEKADDLKVLVKAQKDKQDAEKSELQKATEKLSKYETDKAEYESKLADAEGELASLRLQAAIGQELRKQKLEFVSPEAEGIGLEKLALLVETDDAGKPKNMEAVIKSFAKDFAFLLGANNGTGSHGTPRTQKPNPTTGQPGQRQPGQPPEPQEKVLTL